MDDVREVTADDVLALRMSELRAGMPASESRFPGDDEPTTFHAGVIRDGAIVCVASMYREVLPPLDASFVTPSFETVPPSAAIWRLRGMATHPSARNTGAGRRILTWCMGRIRTHGGELVWCNARVGAIGFYENCGWMIVSDEFDIPTAGPHRVMIRRVTDTAKLPLIRAEKFL
jgi:GNAT superfamily N-acetyltransferase